MSNSILISSFNNFRPWGISYFQCSWEMDLKLYLKLYCIHTKLKHSVLGSISQRERSKCLQVTKSWHFRRKTADSIWPGTQYLWRMHLDLPVPPNAKLNYYLFYSWLLHPYGKRNVKSGLQILKFITEIIYRVPRGGFFFSRGCLKVCCLAASFLVA